MDPRSLSAVEYGLWFGLRCHCQKCGAERALPALDSEPWNGDSAGWAKDMAPLIQVLGWSQSDDGFGLFCPDCRPSP
jgi:hypothetical protein